MPVILVTGTPATGKTTIAKKLAEKLDLTYLDVNRVIEEHNLSKEFDKKRNTHIIDTKKLNRILIKTIKKNKNLVIDSHLSHYLNKKYVDCCIVTTCNLKELKKRLEKRGYRKDKVRENLDAEIFNTCLTEAQEHGHKTITVETDKRINWKKLLSYCNEC